MPLDPSTLNDDTLLPPPTLWAVVTPAQWATLMAVPGFAAEVDLPPEDAQPVIGPRPLGRVLIDGRLDGTPDRFWMLFFEAHPASTEALRLITGHFGGVFTPQREIVWRPDR
jgi:hypothetical protein